MMMMVLMKKRSSGGTTTIADTTMMTKCLAWLPSSGHGLVPSYRINKDGCTCLMYPRSSFAPLNLCCITPKLCYVCGFYVWIVAEWVLVVWLWWWTLVCPPVAVGYYILVHYHATVFLSSVIWTCLARFSLVETSDPCACHVGAVAIINRYQLIYSK
jgi:hypothetical protein